MALLIGQCTYTSIDYWSNPSKYGEIVRLTKHCLMPYNINVFVIFKSIRRAI